MSRAHYHLDRGTEVHRSLREANEPVTHLVDCTVSDYILEGLLRGCLQHRVAIVGQFNGQFLQALWLQNLKLANHCPVPPAKKLPVNQTR